MSKGLSKMQRQILGLLDGTEKPCFYSCGGTLTTSELRDELVECRMLDESRPRKQLMAMVLRACRSLLDRDLVEGVYDRNWDHGPSTTISWTARPKLTSPQPA